jgi:hypothetical protein
MIPPVSHPTWTQLVSGQKKLTSGNVGVNMLILNSTLKFQRDSSPASVAALIQHAHEFFVKYQSILRSEIHQLSF